MSDIMALHSEGASSLCVNGSVDMLGRLAGISASKYTGYPPYDDAPKEGELDWDLRGILEKLQWYVPLRRN